MAAKLKIKLSPLEHDVLDDNIDFEEAYPDDYELKAKEVVVSKSVREVFARWCRQFSEDEGVDPKDRGAFNRIMRKVEDA